MNYNRYNFITVEKEDGIAIITLNRPNELNAFSPQLHTELEEVFEDIAKDQEVNSVILTGAGKAFSVGGDIRAFDACLKDPSLPRITLDGARSLIWRLLDVEQPLIAAVNGDAIGLGATLALFCDIIIVSESARIGDPHVKVGLVAGDGGAIIWPLLIGPALAKEMLFTGDLLNAQDVGRVGLVNKVVPAEEVIPTATSLAKRLAKGPMMAIRYTKRSVNMWLRQQVNLILDSSLALEYLTFDSQDHREAVTAFLEKREPQFTGK